MSLGDIPKIPPKYKPRVKRLFDKIKANETSLEQVLTNVLTATGKVTLDSHGLTILGDYGKFEVDKRILDDAEEAMVRALDALPLLPKGKKQLLIKKGNELTKVTIGLGVWLTRAKPEDLKGKTLPIVEIVADRAEATKKKVINFFDIYLETPLEERVEVPQAIKIHRLEEIGAWMGNDWKAAGALMKAMEPLADLTTKEVLDKLNETMDPFCDHVLKKCGV